MIDLFSPAWATLKADTYFATTLGGFKDSQGNFKMFKGNEAPTAETPFITADMVPGSEERTNWSTPAMMFHVVGKDIDWADLYTIARRIRDVFMGSQIFAAVGDDDPVQYDIVGKTDWGEGRNPVTEQVYVSIAVHFGIVS